MGLFSRKSDQVELALRQGGALIDVRSPAEYALGHAEGSINIPLDNIRGDIQRIKQLKRPVITCCASGMRSATAASVLQQQGVEVYNGGSWTKVSRLVETLSGV